MRFVLNWACCLAWLLAGAAQAGEPRHLPLGDPRLHLRGLPMAPAGSPRPVNPLATSNLILEDDQPLTSFDFDRDLSRRCREGRFRQQREHLYIVRLGGFIHGAVIGGEWGLYDADRVAVPGLVYALRRQDTGRCEVYILRHLPG